MSQEFNKNNFEKEVIEASKVKPVVVDFYAAWCSPCKLQGPIIDELAESLADKVSVGKINVDDEQEIASNYGVMSIPTVLIFKGGQVVETLVGLNSKMSLMAVIEKNL
jgi:thioredoxin 1